MKHHASKTPDELDGLPTPALVSLTHAFRRELSRTPTRREHMRIERERTRRFVDTTQRHWRVDER